MRKTRAELMRELDEWVCAKVNEWTAGLKQQTDAGYTDAGNRKTLLDAKTSWYRAWWATAQHEDESPDRGSRLMDEYEQWREAGRPDLPDD